MDVAVLKSFGNEIEKIALTSGLLMGGMHMLGLKDEIKTMQQKSTINPLRRDAAMKLKLRSPYSYQFEGGKTTGLTETTTPHTF